MKVRAEELAQRFHEIYEDRAPHHGYETREDSRKPWGEVPEGNRRLMIDVCGRILVEFTVEREPNEVEALAAKLLAITDEVEGEGDVMDFADLPVDHPYRLTLMRMAEEILSVRRISIYRGRVDTPKGA